MDLIQRYFRKTSGYPEGTICHDGDCRMWSDWICTCGLLHLLMPEDDEYINKNYPNYWSEIGMHRNRLDALPPIDCKMRTNSIMEEEDHRVFNYLRSLSVGSIVEKQA